MPKYIVRYGAMRSLGVMSSKQDQHYRRGMEVVVRSNRGLEVGQVLIEASDDTLSHLDNPPTGHILREVSADDTKEVGHIDSSRLQKIETCQKHIDNLNLDMKLVEVEQLFGGERLIIYYLAEERVDFRQLVKDLANEFQTRIEMKQIGVRDEAKLLADYGDCGKPVCCATHLVTMPPVSMKMAKLQKATLDPTKISGRCGRLKCCLRYEFEHYETVQKQMPRVGQSVLTRNGRMRVIGQEILAEQLLVETEDHRRLLIDASEVLSVLKPGEYETTKPRKPKPGARDSAGSKDSRDQQSATNSEKSRGKKRRKGDRKPAGPKKSSQESVDLDSDQPKKDKDRSPRSAKQDGNEAASEEKPGKSRRRGRRRGKRSRKRGGPDNPSKSDSGPPNAP